jgi:predicted DNA-binding protein
MLPKQPSKINFTFPRTTFATSNGLFEQLNHIGSELSEVNQAFLNEPIERVAEELVDLYHSVETALRIIDERYVLIVAVAEKVAEKNLRRGYYL